SRSMRAWSSARSIGPPASGPLGERSALSHRLPGRQGAGRQSPTAPPPFYTWPRSATASLYSPAVTSVRQLAFLSAGTMGGAIVRGVLAASVVKPAAVAVYDLVRERSDELAGRHSMQAAASDRTAVADA